LVIHEEQTQNSQEQVSQEPIPLRRSTRERTNVVPDDYIVFLQEHEENNGMTEAGPINFSQAVQDSNSEKGIEAMKGEYKSMQDKKV
jgi:hypothetical protein